MEIHTAVKQRINNLLLENKWSVNELSRRSGVNQSTLSEIVSGRSKHPRIITLKKISYAFNMTLSDFFNDECFDDLE